MQELSSLRYALFSLFDLGGNESFLRANVESESLGGVRVIWFKLLQALVPVCPKAWLFFWCKTPVLQDLAWDHQLILYRQSSSRRTKIAFVLPNGTSWCLALYCVLLPLRHLLFLRPSCFTTWMSLLSVNTCAEILVINCNLELQWELLPVIRIMCLAVGVPAGGRGGWAWQRQVPARPAGGARRVSVSLCLKTVGFVFSLSLGLKYCPIPFIFLSVVSK